MSLESARPDDRHHGATARAKHRWPLLARWLEAALTLSEIDPDFAHQPDPPERVEQTRCRHGCARGIAARTTMTQRTRLSAASRVCCAGLQKAQPALDPSPRRKTLLARAKK